MDLLGLHGFCGRIVRRMHLVCICLSGFQNGRLLPISRGGRCTVVTVLRSSSWRLTGVFECVGRWVRAGYTHFVYCAGGKFPCWFSAHCATHPPAQLPYRAENAIPFSSYFRLDAANRCRGFSGSAPSTYIHMCSALKLIFYICRKHEYGACVVFATLYLV